LAGRNTLLGTTVVVLFLLLVVGAYVTAAGYGGLCGLNTPEDWPLCNGRLIPPPDFGSIIEYTHRILASLSGLLLILTTAAFWRSAGAPTASRRMLLLALVLIVVEIGVGGVVVNTLLSPAIVTLHQGFALLIFGFTVAAAVVSFRER
jgi:cytochrome c oxidase assembly protein subunit 15